MTALLIDAKWSFGYHYVAGLVDPAQESLRQRLSGLCWPCGRYFVVLIADEDGVDALKALMESWKIGLGQHATLFLKRISLFT